MYGAIYCAPNLSSQYPNCCQGIDEIELITNEFDEGTFLKNKTAESLYILAQNDMLVFQELGWQLWDGDLANAITYTAARPAKRLAITHFHLTAH